MPTYEYECSSCGHAFEAFQSITAEPIRKCPECGRKVQRLISAGSGIIFRGSGFYTTDYRSKEYKEQARKETEAPKKDGEKGAKKGKDKGKKTGKEKTTGS